MLCFVFRLYAFVEAAALRSVVLQYAGAPIATRVSFLWFISRCRFFRVFLYYFHFLFVWRVRRTFFPSEWCRTTLISKTFRSARRSTTWRQSTGGGIRASTKDPSRSVKIKMRDAGNSRALFIFPLLPCLPKPSLAFYGAGREIFAAKKRLKQDIDLNRMDFRLDTHGGTNSLYPPPPPWRGRISVRGVTTGSSEGGVLVGGVD